MQWLLVVVVGLGLLFFLASRKEDLRKYDEPRVKPFSSGPELNDEHLAVIGSLLITVGEMSKLNRADRLVHMRRHMDEISDGHDYPSQFIACSIGDIPAEWVLAPGADSSRRLLYLHGGAFTMGSPKSHRTITSKLSEIAGVAVLAIDYRLMPEHPRKAGIEDCQTAYRWILDNGPEGPGSLTDLFVAGDSAGGNLTLSVIAWARDCGLRPANAVVALSPVTDSTMSGHSIRTNEKTDEMLRPMMAPINRLPDFARPLIGWLAYRSNPTRPVISPVFGDLSGLPPILVHASHAEMLRDDAQRYVNKAIAQGSQATLQTWDHVAHVWHIFDPDLTEAREAFAEIAQFLATHSKAQSAAA